MKRLGLIGLGGLTQVVLPTLADHLPRPLERLSILVLAKALGEARRRMESVAPALAKEIAVHSDLGAFLADAPELVAECAGHSAVRQYGSAILESGCDLILASVGSLAEDDLRASLERAAKAGGSRLLLPAGAVGGIDVLAAARLSGLRSVTYTGRKPPRAWLGTPAEALLDLATLREPAAFFDGTARQAARDYPQNANVAAILALAGLGFDETRVKLVADPRIERNLHEVSVESACTRFTVKIEGMPLPGNPKTSLTAGFSLARQILNRNAELVI